MWKPISEIPTDGSTFLGVYSDDTGAYQVAHVYVHGEQLFRICGNEPSYEDKPLGYKLLKWMPEPNFL